MRLVTTQLLGRIITLFIASVKEVMDPSGIAGGNEKQRLVFLQCHLWPLQIHIYIFIYLRVYASAIGMYNVFIAAIQRITSVYVSYVASMVWSCRLWAVRPCILLLCSGNNIFWLLFWLWPITAYCPHHKI